MKNQALFSSKDKSKTLKCRLLQFLFGALRVKCNTISSPKLRCIIKILSIGTDRSVQKVETQIRLEQSG